MVWAARITSQIDQNTQVRVTSENIPTSPFTSLFLFACVDLDSVLQLQDLLPPMKVTGHAGLIGQAVADGHAPGHAGVTPMGSLELCAEETPEVKNTAEQINDHLTSNLKLNQANQ